jgi:hypothetical protein
VGRACVAKRRLARHRCGFRGRSRFDRLPAQVQDLKVKIHNELKLGEPEHQKLIHAGKILRNEVTIGSAGIKENDFVVVMVSKVPIARVPAARPR